MTKFNYAAARELAQARQQQFNPVPKGPYTVQILSANRETYTYPESGATSTAIDLAMVILGPTHAGRRLFAKLHLSHPNAAAETAGHASLSEVVCACGVESYFTSAEGEKGVDPGECDQEILDELFVGRELVASVYVTKDKTKNRISKYSAPALAEAAE